MKAFVILGARTLRSLCLPGNPSHHLSDDDEVNDQRRGKQGVLAHIEETDRLMTSHEDLGIVLVQSTFVVAYSRHVLDDHGMVWMFAWLVEHAVGLNHVIYNIGLGNLLGTELLL